MVDLTPELASRFAALALGHVTREYPNKLDHVLRGPDDLRGPRALHPIFYGSFDWHSCVHGYWLLCTLLRTFPALPEAARIVALLDAHLTPENVAGELAYLDAPERATFERPYGWAWLLMLHAELTRHANDDGRRRAEALAPLARAFAQRFLRYLAVRDVSGARGDAREQRVRAGARAGVRGAMPRRLAAGARARQGARVVRR